MAGYRLPGPKGASSPECPPGVGTLAVTPPSTPGPVGTAPPRVDAGSPAGSPFVFDGRPQLSKGSRGQFVRELQERLNERGAKPSLVVDGVFGLRTDAAVRAYQRRRHLRLDGIVGRRTWRDLLWEIRKRPTGGGAEAAPATPNPTKQPGPKPATSPPAKKRRFIQIRWVETETYCGGPATLTGTTENYDDGSAESARVQTTVSATLIAQLNLAISSNAFTQDVPVKNWLPRKIGTDFEEKRDQDGLAAGQKTPKPLTMRFIPSLKESECTLTSSTGVDSHFLMAVKNFQCQIRGDIKYVPGYMAWLIQLGGTVTKPAPAWARALLPSRLAKMMQRQPGGQTGVDWGPQQATSFSGSDWRFAKNDVSSPTGLVYWDGTAWQDVPASWQDPNNVKLYGIGIWHEGTENRAQFGNRWPEPIGSWSPDEQATCDKTLPTWASACKSAWSNKFDLRRHGCPSSNTSCCRYSVVASVKFTSQNVRTGHTIVIGVNAGRSNAGAWSLGDTRPGLAPHEFGHHLGAPDEYAGGVGIDASVNTDGANQGIDGTSLMGSVPNNSVPPVKARHFQIIAQQLSAMIQSEKGVSWNFDVVAHS